MRFGDEYSDEYDDEEDSFPAKLRQELSAHK